MHRLRRPLDDASLKALKFRQASAPFEECAGPSVSRGGLSDSPLASFRRFRDCAGRAEGGAAPDVEDAERVAETRAPAGLDERGKYRFFSSSQYIPGRSLGIAQDGYAALLCFVDVWPGWWKETALIIQALKTDGRHHAQIRLNRPCRSRPRQMARISTPSPHQSTSSRCPTSLCLWILMSWGNRSTSISSYHIRTTPWHQRKYCIRPQSKNRLDTERHRHPVRPDSKRHAWMSLL